MPVYIFIDKAEKLFKKSNCKYLTFTSEKNPSMLILFTASSPLGNEDHVRKLKLALAVIILILFFKTFPIKY